MKVKLEPWAFAPKRAHQEDAGLDLMTPIGFVLEPDKSIVIDTGVHVQIPHGYAGLIVSKSGLNVKCSCTSTGLIDEGYTGSIICKLYNHGKKEVELPAGAKITQLVLVAISNEDVEIVDEIDGSERGNNGFGSSGV